MLTPFFIVRSGFLASGNVGRPHLSSGSVTSGHIGDASVVSGNIGSGQISSGHTCSGFWPDTFPASILSGQIGSGKIASGAVQGFFGSTRHIASGTVGVFDLGSGAVVAGTIGSGSAVSGNIASGQIGHYHLAVGSVHGYGVIGQKFAIDSGTIGWENIAPNRIRSGHLMSGAEGNAAVHRYTIGSGEVFGSINSLGNGWPSHIASGSIGSGDLAVGAVQNVHLANAAVTSGKIASGQIGWTHIANNGVLSGNIGSGQIGRNHLSFDPTTVQRIQGGRLSVMSGVAVIPQVSGVANGSGAVDLYLVPFNDDLISLIPSGVNQVNTYTFDNVRLNLSGQLASGAVYDVYCVVSGGGPALGLSAAWTNSVSGTRNPGTAIQYSTSGGFWIQSGDATRRIVGTIYCYYSGIIDDGNKGRFHVWNMDNRVQRQAVVLESGNSWNWFNDNFHQMNASSGNQVSVVVGLNQVSVASLAYNGAGAGTGQNLAIAIGEDNTTSYDIFSCSPGYAIGPPSTSVVSMVSHLARQIPLGYHYYAAIEKGSAGGTAFYGTAGTTYIRTGLVGTVEV